MRDPSRTLSTSHNALADYNETVSIGECCTMQHGMLSYYYPVTETAQQPAGRAQRRSRSQWPLLLPQSRSPTHQ